MLMGNGERMNSRIHEKCRQMVARWRSRRVARQSGQSVVEFALISMLLFMLMFGLMDFGRLFFTQMTLQHAVREAGRFAVTGNKLPDPNNPPQMLSRVASIQETARKSAAGLDISNISVTSAAGGANSAGGPGDAVTVSLTTTLRLLTPLIAQLFTNGEHTFTVKTTFKNEPFPKSQTS